jgi:hypothetical protein
VAHPYKGIYRVRFDGGMHPQVRRYASGDGLLSINNNYIFKVRNRIVATTENGVLNTTPPATASCRRPTSKSCSTSPTSAS